MPDAPYKIIEGWRSTGRRRIVCRWFRTRIEELWEHKSGRAEWR